MYEANSIIKKVGRKETKFLQSEPSSNGIWYYKVDKGLYSSNIDSVQLVLASKTTHQSVIDMFLGKATGFISKANLQDAESLNKLKYNINDSLKLFNANSMSKLQSLN